MRESFRGCELVKASEEEGHWKLKGPSGSVRVYAAVSADDRDKAHYVNFEYDDVLELLYQDEELVHPLWSGLYEALKEDQVMLHIELPFMAGGEAMVFFKEGLSENLPYWMDTKGIIFNCSSVSDLKEIIRSGWVVSQEIALASQSRVDWADPLDRDDKSILDFQGFLLNKRAKKPKRKWGSHALSSSRASGAFLDVYGIWIDWRDDDVSLINSFCEPMREKALVATEKDDHIQIAFGAREKNLKFDYIQDDRYKTIRALNEVLSPQYEIRQVRKSLGGDTHCFLFAPLWLWQHLESECSEQLNSKIKIIELGDKFS